MSKPALGLVGAIGAGKSTAARALAELGGEAIDCDALGHEALRDAGVIRLLTSRWGAVILNAANGIDRRAVAKIVFSDAAEREFLESVTFPVIRRLAEVRVAGVEPSAARFAVLDAAVLLEAGWRDACDKLLYLDAADGVRLARLRARSGWGEAELRAREAAQWPAGRKKAAADAVIVNDGSPGDLAAKLAAVLTEWGWLPEHSQGA